MLWQPRAPELTIPFDGRERQLYAREDPASRYLYVGWPRRVGRGRHGEFPLVVAREHFRRLGYTVWASEPELPRRSGFILVSYPGKRRANHPAFVRMQAIFGEASLEALNKIADRQKRLRTGNAAGGDPDLFVFRGNERFFVEVKWRDNVTHKQSVTFPLIERMLAVEVKVVRIRETLSLSV